MATPAKGKAQWLAGGGIAQAGGRSALLVLAQALGSKSTSTRTAAARARLKLEEAIFPDVQRSLAGAGEAADAAAGLVTVSSIMSGKKEVSKAGPALHAATMLLARAQSSLRSLRSGEITSAVRVSLQVAATDMQTMLRYLRSSRFALAFSLSAKSTSELRGAFTEIEHALSGGQPVSSGVMRAAQQVCSGASLAMAASGLGAPGVTGFATCSETTGMLALPILTGHIPTGSPTNTAFCTPGGPKIDRIQGPKGVVDLVLCTGDPAFSICGGVDVAFGITGGGSICMAEVFPGPQVAVTLTVGGGGGDDFGASGWVGEVVSPGVNNVGALTGTVECFSQDLVDAGGISGEVCDHGSFSGAAAVGEEVNLGAGTAETTCVLWSTAGTQTCLPTTTGYEVQETLDPNELQQGYINLSGGVTLPASSFPPTITITTAPRSTPRWSAPTDIDGSNTLNSVACPTASFCVAVDNAGNALTWNGTSWSAPRDIDPGHDLDSVSCSSSNFCVAVAPAGDSGKALTWNGTSWSAPTTMTAFETTVTDGWVGPVSCPSRSFCMAGIDDEGDDGGILAWNGTSWSAPNWLHGPAGIIRSVSCSSVSFCVAVDVVGHALIWNGTSWSAPSDIDPSPLPSIFLTSVSCLSAVFCLAVDSAGKALKWNGTSWSSPQQTASNDLYSVSCASSSFCVAVEGYGKKSGYEFTDSGGVWSSGQLIDPHVSSTTGLSLSSVACPSTAFCVAVDDSGNAMTYQST